MARGVNRVILIGNLGNDPEQRFMPSGNAVTNASIATSETWKDKQTGETKERTEWHRVIFFNRLAEIAGEYLKKGSKVYVEGSLRTRKWQDKEGRDQFTTEIVASEMHMLDSRPQGQSASQGYAGDGRQYGTAQGGTAPRGSASNPHQPPNQGHTGNQPPSFDDFDSDIPFNQEAA